MERFSAQLQESFLNTLRKEQVPVAIYLINGIKLQGQIKAFDRYVLLLHNTSNQMIFKHAIATIVPMQQFNWHANIENTQTDRSAEHPDDKEHKVS